MRRLEALALALVATGCFAGGSAPSTPNPRPIHYVPEAMGVAPAPTNASFVPATPSPVAPLPKPSAEPKPAATAPSAKPDAPVDMAKLLGSGGAALKTVMAAPEKYRFQVLYGVVNEGTSPTLTRHGFRADAEYYFPASSMKVPIALAAYERLGAIRAREKPGLTRDAILKFGGDEPATTTLARETWRSLIVSDNACSNRILAFVGHREAHETLWRHGYGSARIRAGFATGAEIDPAEVSPRIDVQLAPGGNDVIAPRRSDLKLPPNDAKDMAIGAAAIVDGRRVEGPLSFADKNAIKLKELQDALVQLMRPDLLPSAAPRTIASDDLAYVRQALGTLPSESGLAGYDRNVVADYQLSPFLRGIERVKKRGTFQIFSKVGQAYGFLIHNAYVVDKATGRSFFLVAAVFANPDGVMNDDNYGYDSISFPALADVGEIFTRHTFP